MKTKNKKTNRIINVIILVAILIASFIVVVIFVNNDDQNDFTMCCREKYLGICFEEESPFYKCNVETKECDLYIYDIVSTIKYMKENNIIIYGTMSCGWCKLQLELFEDYQEKVNFIECDKTPFLCEGVESTPTFKKDNEIVALGYRSLEDIKKL